MNHILRSDLIDRQVAVSLVEHFFTTFRRSNLFRIFRLIRIYRLQLL